MEVNLAGRGMWVWELEQSELSSKTFLVSSFLGMSHCCCSYYFKA